MAVAAAHHSAAVAHGPKGRIDRGVLGMALFIASEAALFASFFAAYFYLRGTSPEWNMPVHGGSDGELAEVPRGLTGVNTIILVASSFTVMVAEAMIKRGKRGAYIGWMVLTITLGLIFLGVQVYEYVHLNFRPGDSALGSTFYALTGLHGAHVAIGATLLTIGLIRGAKGFYSPPNPHGSLTSFSLYWHFVDVVWVFLYGTVYLWQP